MYRNKGQQAALVSLDENTASKARRKITHQLRKVTMRIWLIAIALVALAACSSQEGPHEPAIPTATATSDAPAPPQQEGPLFTPAQGPEMADPENFNQADQDRCAAAGGSYEMAGILGWYRCTISFADAGTACTDNSDCMGQCRAENGGAGFDRQARPLARPVHARSMTAHSVATPLCRMVRSRRRSVSISEM